MNDALVEGSEDDAFDMHVSPAMGTVDERAEILSAMVETFDGVYTETMFSGSAAYITVKRGDTAWSVSVRSGTADIYILDNAVPESQTSAPSGAWYGPMEALVHLYRELSA